MELPGRGGAEEEMSNSRLSRMLLLSRPLQKPCCAEMSFSSLVAPYHATKGAHSLSYISPILYFLSLFLCVVVVVIRK